MNALDYPIVIEALAAQDARGFAVIVPDLPGCISDGETQQEAFANVQDAIRAWIEAAQQMGRAAPPPSHILSRRYLRKQIGRRFIRPARTGGQAASCGLRRGRNRSVFEGSRSEERLFGGDSGRSRMNPVRVANKRMPWNRPDIPYGLSQEAAA